MRRNVAQSIRVPVIPVAFVSRRVLRTRFEIIHAAYCLPDSRTIFTRTSSNPSVPSTLNFISNGMK